MQLETSRGGSIHATDGGKRHKPAPPPTPPRTADLVAFTSTGQPAQGQAMKTSTRVDHCGAQGAPHRAVSRSPAVVCVPFRPQSMNSWDTLYRLLATAHALCPRRTICHALNMCPHSSPAEIPAPSGSEAWPPGRDPVIRVEPLERDLSPDKGDPTELHSPPTTEDAARGPSLDKRSPQTLTLWAPGLRLRAPEERERNVCCS